MNTSIDPAPPDLNTLTRREIEDYLVERAMIDPVFRRRLRQDPELLLHELGLVVGQGVKIQVLEEEPHSFFIVLPRELRDMEQLSEEELDQVEGGVESLGTVQRFFQGYI